MSARYQVAMDWNGDLVEARHHHLSITLIQLTFFGKLCCYFMATCIVHNSSWWKLTISLEMYIDMMTSSNGNIFRVTGHLCGEFTGPRWIPHTKASDAELWCFFDLQTNKRLSKQWWGWWLETLSRPLCRHRNAYFWLVTNKAFIKLNIVVFAVTIVE